MRHRPSSIGCAYEVAGDPSCAAVIVCDHPPAITIGRQGSRMHVRTEPLAAIRWVARGGGVVLHAPGQVACYPILPLDRMQLTPAAYLAGLRGVVGDLLAGFGVRAESDSTTVRVNGRRIAHFGVAVRNWVTSFGFVLNVAPDLELFRDIDCDGDPVPVTSLQRECPTRVRIPAVRQRLLELLARRFDFGRVSVFHSPPDVPPANPAPCAPCPSSISRPPAGCRTGSSGRCRPATATSSPQNLIDDLRLETVCEEAPLPEPPGVLVPADRHVHGPRQRLHPAVRVLFGGEGATRSAVEDDEPQRVAEAAAPARPAARRHHVRDAGRPARRRGRPLRPLRPGRARRRPARRSRC